MIGSRSQLGPWIIVVANNKPGHICIRNNVVDYYELKQPEVEIHMIKKKIMKPQLVSRSKATNRDEKDICVKVLTSKNGND